MVKSEAWLLLVLLFHRLARIQGLFEYNATFPIRCRRPDVQAPLHPDIKERRFSTYSLVTAGGGGIGNILVFFPVAWLFAAVSGYDMAIEDESMIGKFCSVIECNIPMVSEVAKRYPLVKQTPRFYKFDQIRQHLTGGIEIKDIVISVHGYQSHHSSYMYSYKGVKDCISSITGCPVEDIACMEHMAYQALVKGPFTAQAAHLLKSRVQDFPPQFLHKILHLPLSEIPRIDASFQLRMQYDDLERGRERNSSRSVFLTQEGDMLVQRSIETLSSYLTNPQSPYNLRGHVPRRPIIYVSCDDSVDKEMFVEKLRNSSFLRSFNTSRVHVTYVKDVKNMTHTKQIGPSAFQTFQKSDFYDNFVHTVFDWYMLAISNIVYTHRDGRLVSTFAESAARLTDRDVCDYSKFGKLWSSKCKACAYEQTWTLDHPGGNGNKTCQVPPHLHVELL